ncbi:MAG: HEAT repeat domain-containing protein [Deltaproteobacteria bacterium]|nr:HEAT repeat domain-containing protein [Deltaproteobacteria bacterium]
MAPIRELPIPGTNLTMVDGNKDGRFIPRVSCYQIKRECEAYQCPGTRPACPNDESVIKALRNAGFANAITSLEPPNFTNGSFEENWACLSGTMDGLKSMLEMQSKLKDSDPKIRYDAAAGLVGLTEKVDLCTLFAVVKRELKESPYADIRSWAAQSLGQPGQCDSIEPLTEALKDEKSNDVRYSIVWALGRIQNEDTVETLSNVLAKDPSPEIKKIAISAIALFRANNVFANKSRREEKFICLAPEEGLWDEIYHNYGVDSLLLALRHDPNENTRMDAAEKLGLFCSTKVTDGLIQTLLDEDENTFVRVQSALSLGLNANLPIVRGALLAAFFDGSRGLENSLLDFDPLVDAVETVLNRHRWWL